MDKQHIEAFSNIRQPFRESFGFIADIQKPIKYHFRSDKGCDPGQMRDCMLHGVEIKIDFPQDKGITETVFESIRRVLRAKDIQEAPGSFQLNFIYDPRLEEEEYRVKISPKGVLVAASDGDGMRRGIYFLEERICEAAGKSVISGEWKQKPFVKHRISRCFFGPTNRPPFYIDELLNDIDYYPEEYLNKLAHEGINGLWLTMYFKDLPSSLFPGRGKDSEKRLAKLRLIVERCARYGIRIYVFLSEPKPFGKTHLAIPLEEAGNHPELIGFKLQEHGYFCTSTPKGEAYLRESVAQIFETVPGLGGVINIMMGEDNGSCVAYHTITGNWNRGQCPSCSTHDDAELYSRIARVFSEEMHKYNPAAEYIGWFYAPGQRDDSDFMKRLRSIADQWPDDCTLMFNFESGGTAEQLGKKRIVFDYSLAYIGPSALFRDICCSGKKIGAKLQVGCSHENASIPFMPVPENLYYKYKFLKKHHVSTVMQCWYFGNYPGLMNKAAGKLAFEPFARTESEFLIELARPEWREDAVEVARAWHLFSKAYRMFPANIAFEWFGPMHHCITWPLHLFPVDEPIAPSWILKNFPEVSGDRIGECLGFHHTLPEALQLCRAMSNTWQQGLNILQKLRSSYFHDSERMDEISLAEAISLQMKSTVNLLEFYFLRENIYYLRQDNLNAMMTIVRNEINNTEKMLILCEQDSRLGYHSEAEGYLFFPEKLSARIALLKELLDSDFPRFDLNASWIDEYTGIKPTGKVAECRRKGVPEDIQPLTPEASWSACFDEENLVLTFDGMRDKDFSIEIEPCRMWAPLRVFIFASGEHAVFNKLFPAVPDIKVDLRTPGRLVLIIPLDIFNGFRRKGFPMRINVHFHDGNDSSWINGEKWPWRLLYGNCNPACMGFLIIKDSE